jgi:hypothetical protein
MDFGFLRASNPDYSRPDKSNDRIVESIDGYTSYLLIVDEFTRHVWVFLCNSKEPPIDIVNLHLDVFGSRLGGSIRCDQGGELARSHEFVNQMTLRQYSVEPTSADNPAQNKSVEKWNDIYWLLPSEFYYMAPVYQLFFGPLHYSMPSGFTIEGCTEQQ